MRRIGVLMPFPADDPEAQVRVAGLLQGLQELGWTVGRNVRIDWRFSLVDRGFVFAIAHIRGGSELGRPWYDNGKLLNKRNSFTDFIACAESLISASPNRSGWTGRTVRPAAS